MKTKKIPYYLTLLLLTSGASLILGFLSFGGMFSMWPVLPLAFTAFGLSVAYEGEIYLQNIKGALNKLFKFQFLERQFAKDYLLEHSDAIASEACPAFFKDYKHQLNLLHCFGHKRLEKDSAKEKRKVEKTLRDMEKWFALQLFNLGEDPPPGNDYEAELQRFLASHDQALWKSRIDARQQALRSVKAFSLFAGLFMGLGTTYLLVEAFSVIPFFAAMSFSTWPFVIVPMAGIAGTAYGLLTYNAVTDMISNDTLRKWYNQIKNNGLTPHNIFMAFTASVLVTLAIALTICTAGTWWTVAKETRPLFSWMGKMPSYIMGVINPLITGFSAVVFNLENSSESLGMINDATKPHHHEHKTKDSGIVNWLKKSIKSLQQRENLLQQLNPFRVLLKITVMPLRILLFIGHLISIGVTADRVPGISQTFSALLGIISEGFEDAHYFISHEHGHHHHNTKELLSERLGSHAGHNHDIDLPTRALTFLFSPVYLLAASWDYLSSKLNTGTRSQLGFFEAWDKQTGLKKEETVKLTEGNPRPSSPWQLEHVIFRIQRHKEKQLKHIGVDRNPSQETCSQLSKLQLDLIEVKTTDEIKCLISQAKQGFFANSDAVTKRFLDELPERVSINCI